MAFYLKKATGEVQEFDLEKLRRSLTRPGASQNVVDDIVDYIQKNIKKFRTTDDIYRFSLDRLTQHEPYIATRYNLKRALIEFGPTGYPFEKFVSYIFKSIGYKIIGIDQILSGWCVDHEIDLIIEKNSDDFLVECKFHNEQHYRTDVQVALYTEARFHDIQRNLKSEEDKKRLGHTWIVTNTKFTDEAIKYGNCSGMRLTSWNYPKEDNIANLIARYGLYPVTALTSLKKHQKKFLIENGVVLAKDLKEKSYLLEQLGIRGADINKIVKEAQLACKC